MEKHLRETRKRVPSAKQLQSKREAAQAVNTALNNRIQQVNTFLKNQSSS